MVRKYIRKTDKGKWTVDELKEAKQAIAEGLSLRKAAQKFKIPCSTLRMRLKSGTESEPSPGRKCDFPPTHEEALAAHIKISMISYGITATQLRKIAFEYAEKNNLNHRFNKQTRMAGLDWMYGFMARNKINLRKPGDWNDQEKHCFMVDIDNPSFCKQEDENHQNPINSCIYIKTEPDLTDYISQDDVSQDNMTKDSIPGCSRLNEGVSVSEALDCMVEEVDHTTSIHQEKYGNHCNSENIGLCSKEHFSSTNFHSSVEEFSNAKNISKTGTERHENNQTKMLISSSSDQEPQTNELPITERCMMKWNNDQPIAESVLNEVVTKRCMLAAERKRKNREKQLDEAKKPENCSCGTNLKTRDKLKAEVCALAQRKELLSAQITLLQAQSQQVKLGLTEIVDSEDDSSSNVSANDPSTEGSRLKDVFSDAQAKTKRAISIEKCQNNDSAFERTFFAMNGMLDDFKIFGEFVATELRNLKSDVNRKRLKRMIQKMIIEVSESEDR